MRKPDPKTNYLWFPHRLRTTIVYLFILILGTVLSNVVAAKQDLPPAQNILLTILVAEMAASRHMNSIALNNYLQATLLTKNESLAKEATEFAINAQAPTEAMMCSEVWANAAQNNLQAQLVAMTLTIGQSVEKAIPYLKQAIKIDPIEVEQNVNEIQNRLSKISGVNLNKALTSIAASLPSDPFAQLIAADSFISLGDIKNVKRYLEAALNLKPDLTPAVELKTKITKLEKGDKAALQYIAKQVEAFPENNELRLFFANQLLENEDRDAARLQYSQLVKDKKTQGFALLMLGEIALKEKKWQEAEAVLQKALETPNSKEGAEFLLGDLAEQQGNKDVAIQRYSNVSSGHFHVPAMLRAVKLLKAKQSYKEAITLLHNSNPETLEEQKQLLIKEIDLLSANKETEEAMQLAEEILPKLPDDTEVLYIHAITAAKLKQWTIAENDLRKMLKLNPNDANALNALGEVLWINNRKEEAKVIWAQSREKNVDNSELSSMLKRLKVDLKS